MEQVQWENKFLHTIPVAHNEEWYLVQIEGVDDYTFTTKVIVDDPSGNEIREQSDLWCEVVTKALLHLCGPTL